MTSRFSLGARISTVLALTAAGVAAATTLPTITDKATGWDSPSTTLNIDTTGTIPTLSLQNVDQKAGDWYRRTWNDTDFDVQAEKEVGDSVFTDGDRCLLNSNNGFLQGTQPLTIGGYPYRTGPQTETIGPDVYVATAPTGVQIPVPSTLDTVTAVRFLTGGARIADSNYTVRFRYTAGSPATNDVVVPIKLDSVSGAARNASVAGQYTVTNFTGLTNNTTVVWDAGAPVGTDCTGAGSDQVVVTNPEPARAVSTIEFIYTDYSPVETQWLGGPLAIALESDQLALESTYDYVGLWTSSVTTADAPVDMPAHSTRALWYRFDYNATIANSSAIFVHFQCGNDTNSNGSLAAGELSVEQIEELSDGAGSIDLATVCSGRYVKYSVEIVDAYDDNPTLNSISFTFDADNDNDGFGANGEIGTADPDCNDNNVAIFPGAPGELPGTNVDTNCDGDILCFIDADNDGFRTTNLATNAGNGDGDCNDLGEALATDPATDCDDTQFAVKPGAAEIAGDNIDQNCDTDELCYVDGDNDSARTNGTAVSTDTDCNDTNEGIFGDPIDCNDGDPAINPAAVEGVGDGIDQNCDLGELCFPDVDNDNNRAGSGQVVSANLSCGDAFEGALGDPVDCNEGNNLINSFAAEIPGDLVDQNCNGREDCFVDSDNDNARTTTNDPDGTIADLDCDDANEGKQSDPIDCDDGNPNRSPLLSETVGNEVDNDCLAGELCWPNTDNDSDRAGTGSVVSGDTDCDDAFEGETTDTVDCDDTLSTRASSNAETVGNNVDNDCSGLEDCFVDNDDDGTRTTTVDPGGTVADQDCLDAGEGEAGDPSPDCNDNDANVRLGIAETPGNNVDNDCSGSEDCFVDGDDDNARTTVVDPGGTNNDTDCNDANEGQATHAIDCDDAVATINPAAIEQPGDSVDQNCDTDELCYTDADNDGARLNTTVVSTDTDCNDNNEGVTGDAIDCVDSDPAINPAALELKGDEIDQNCDTLETCWPDNDNDDDRATVGSTNSGDIDCDDPNEATTGQPQDCDDNDATRASRNAEISGNEKDDNCDLVEKCLVDFDNDDTHAATGTIDSVSPDFDCDDSGEDPSGTPEDCVDTNASINPLLDDGDAAYLANEVDNDCDGGEICMEDTDNDDYSTPDTVVSSDPDCDDSGEDPASAGDDCNDANAAVNPGEVDVCGNGVDDNCTGNASDHGGLRFDDDDGDTLNYAFESTYRFNGVGTACLSDCDDDSDGDGVDDQDEVATQIRTDACDTDTDNDGLSDDAEIGPNVNAPLNTDGDGLIDALDADDDNDGIPTSVERVAVANPDGDALQNYHDLDSDDDGWDDSYEYANLDDGTDQDRDGNDNYVDTDSDGDLLPDDDELGTETADVDSDRDGIDNRLDDDDDDDCVPTRSELGPVANPTNTDGDGLVDYLDDDDDNDSITSCGENPDNVGTPFADDTDLDGQPNFRDDDDDNDGIDTIVEFAFTDPACFTDDATPPHLDTDSDNDNFPDIEESPAGVLVATDNDASIDMCDQDSDQDRVRDINELHADTDLDNLDDRVDRDDDGDGYFTDLECGFPTVCDSDPMNDDTDRDGVDNYLDDDDDDDGIPTEDEQWDGGSAPATAGDTDGDGTPDWADDDDDNDNVATLFEEPFGTDTDGDGAVNHRDDDDDNDLLDTIDEVLDVGDVPQGFDYDLDGIPNYLDFDDDNDGKYTQCEFLWLDVVRGDHLNDDIDQDGVLDGEEWPGVWLDGTPDDCISEPADTDGDGTVDVFDEDDDNDGILTFLEGIDDLDCEWNDADGDGIVDRNELSSIPVGDGVPAHRDLDTDGDGIADGSFDPEDTTQLENFGIDGDNDNIDNIDDCDQSGCSGDSDNDGLSNAEETRACCRIFEATGDDSIFDGAEWAVGSNEINTVCAALDVGVVAQCGCVLTGSWDSDLDGVTDPQELGALSGAQPDSDGDDIADVLDVDDDGDGLSSRDENLFHHPVQPDGNPGCSTAVGWDEGDRSTLDCSAAFYPRYDNTTEDAAVDPRRWRYVCAATPINRDNPEADNLIDLCPTNVDDPLAIEPLPFPGNPLARNTDNLPNYLDEDDDGDGILTSLERSGEPDVDGDGIVNWYDRADENGGPFDADGDGLSNDFERDLGLNEYSDDSDGDGLTDEQELGNPGSPRDTDSDGVIDALDADDDNDGVPTAEEGRGDSDDDGTPDYLDADADDDGIDDGAEQLGDLDCDGIPDVLDDDDTNSICDSDVRPLEYKRESCSCESTSTSSSMALAVGALALLVRRRRGAIGRSV